MTRQATVGRRAAAVGVSLPTSASLPSASVRAIAFVLAIAFMLAMAFVLEIVFATGAARAAPTITEYSTGLASDAAPLGISTPVGGKLWFTQSGGTPAIDSIASGGAIASHATGTTYNPSQIAVGPEGDLWFTEHGAVVELLTLALLTQSYVYSFDPASGVLTPYELPGSSEPEGVTVGPEGDIWFAEAGSKAIGKIVPGNRSPSEFSLPGGSGEPREIVADDEGDLWFTEGKPSAVGRYDPGTRTFTTFSSGLTPGSEPLGIALGPEGDIWFTEAASPGRIGRITPTGSIEELSSGLTVGTPESIVAASDGDLYFTESNGDGALASITPSGEITEYTAGLTKKSEPSGIASGPEGNIWFLERGSPARVGMLTVPPSAMTGAATAVSPDTESVSATLGTNAQDSEYSFEYGPTSSYGQTTAPRSDPAAASRGDVSQTIEGLQPESTYHYRVLATNASGSTDGLDMTFTTAPESTAKPPGETPSESPQTSGGGPSGEAGGESESGGESSGGGSESGGESEPGGEQSPRAGGESPVETGSGSEPGGESSLDPQQAPVESPLELEDPPAGVGGTLFSAPPPPPQMGVRATVQTESGTVGVRSSSGSFAPLGSAGSVPIGAAIDATHGTLEILTSLGGGKVQAAKVWGGVFVVRQSASGDGMTSFVLVGKPPRCRRPGRAHPKLAKGVIASAAKHRRRRHRKRDELWAHDKGGRYSTHGANSVATVLGTTWGTIETCKGTVTRVRQGRVRVRNLQTHRAVIVTAGHRYLAHR